MFRSDRSKTLLLIILILAALPACRSTTWNARFTPALAEALVGPISITEGGTEPNGPPVARVLFSVLGAERPGGDKEAPFEMHVRFRVENRTDADLEVVLAGFLLLDANLAAFGAVRREAPADSEGILTVPAGQPVLLDLMFPFPDGKEPDDLNLDGLNVRGALRSGDVVYPVGATFTRGPRFIYRDPWYGYYPYYGPWIGPGYYGGYGYRW